MIIKDKEIKFVKKKWGWEKWYKNSEKYCFKLLHIDNGWQVSLHEHHEKIESFFIKKGVLLLESEDGKIISLKPGEMVTIEPYTYHRFFTDNEYCEFYEISTHHEDSDSYRKELSCKRETK